MREIVRETGKVLNKVPVEACLAISSFTAVI